VRADVISNTVKPGRFAVLDGKLTLHVRERQPNGQLLGVLIDDQRNPKERLTILSETGDIVTNDRGTFLLLKDGTVQRQTADQHDPQIVRFDQYGFDLSQLSGGPQNITYSVQERYPWELMHPAAKDPLYAAQPGQFRAELHKRMTAPLYPIAFLVITFAYLGAPRTTRQSRTLSLVGAISVALALRGIGFLTTLAGADTPAMLVIPYVTLLAAIAFGAWGIMRGVIIEPPEFLVRAVNTLIEGVSRRTAGAPGQAQ
jgi:lipopolysaccharide export system permease protein